MAAEGELLIFARAGLAQRMVLESERNLASGRALLLSPSCRRFRTNPGLRQSCTRLRGTHQSVSSSVQTAHRQLLPETGLCQGRSCNCRAPGRQSHLAGCAGATEPSDVLDWLEDRVTPGPLPGIAHEALQRPSSPASTPIAEDDGALADAAPPTTVTRGDSPDPGQRRTILTSPQEDPQRS